MDLDGESRGTHTTLGITKLCKGLKGSAVTSLRCAATQGFDFVSAPIDTHLLSHCPRQPPGSLYGNNIGPEGASALAAVLKETQITNLKCAATP